MKNPKNKPPNNSDINDFFKLLVTLMLLFYTISNKKLVKYNKK